MTDLTNELREALEYMIDVHHSDVAMTPEQQAPLQQAAYWKAIAACRRANTELGALQRQDPLSKARRASIALEGRLPVKQELAAAYQVTRQRMANALPVIDAWATYPYEDQKRKAATFLGLAQRLLDQAAQQASPLPTTTACICPRPNCKTILLPDVAGSYTHCGMTWQHHRSLNHQALPGDFWATHRPGDRFTKRLEPALDGRGREELDGAA